MEKLKRIYLDHAATTPLCTEAREAMSQCMTEITGNASGVYQSARDAKQCLEQARAQAARCLHALPEEIYFTSGGSESDNWALKGIAFREHPGCHIITTMIEHPAILKTCRFLEKCGYEISYIQPDRQGFIHPEDIRAAIRQNTVLISVMWANNEIGTIQPVEEIAAIARDAGVPFHTDAVQAAGILPINAHETGIDLLSLSAHKFYGPKGIGVLFIRRGTAIEPLIHGGEQERGLRASTENICGAAGLAAALQCADERLTDDTCRLSHLRDTLLSELRQSLPGIIVNGSMDHRLPGNLHLTIPGVDDKSLIPLLDMNGIEASAGSACTAGSYVESHVLKAIQVPAELLRGSLRITLGRENTYEDIIEAARRITQTVLSLRNTY